MEFIKSEYNRLSSKEYKFTLIEEVKRLRELALSKQSDEYYYLCNILIADIYLEHNNFEEPLKLLSQDIKKIDKTVFENLYISILDRVLYIYITRKNFRLAYHYAIQKIKYIKKDNIDAINRWNLEMSYIYAEMNELDKASECLLNILKNPSEDIYPYVLSNLTKIYVDQKKVVLAEQTLNECLKYTDDEEGKVYCDYLLARVCILKEQKSEAIDLFKNIFENEDINQMTLPIVNEYLELLYSLQMYEAMGLIISKISLFVNASDDFYLQKEFIKNKIRYLSAIKSINGIPELIKDYEEIDKKISISEKKIMFEIMEVETDELVSEQVSDVVSKVDKLTNIISNNMIGTSLRELIMNYNKTLEKVMPFNESTFVLFNKTSNIEYLLNDNILCMNYKNGRLYEKTVSFNALNNTLAKLIIEKNKELAFDLNKTSIDLINIFNNNSYKFDELRYVNAIPCVYQDDIFACMIYSSRKEDITTQDNTVLFRTATKILEASLTAEFLSENLDVTNFTLNNLVSNNNIGLVYIANDTMYLSNALKNYLKLPYKAISRDKYFKMINKSDIERYSIKANLSNDYEIEYKIDLSDRIICVHEKMIPYYDNNKSLLFNVGTIDLKEEDKRTLVDGANELSFKIEDLKEKAKNVEYRYSIIRIRADISKYSFLRSVFGIEPFYVNEKDFVIILENEVNIKTLEKLAERLGAPYSIVRYPRDIVNIEESFNLSKLCLENGYKVFTEEIYKDFLRKRSYNKIINNALGSNIPLILQAYNTNDGDQLVEAKFAFNGLDSIDNIRDYLDDDIKNEYDYKLFRTVIDKNINVRCLVKISNKVIKKMLDANLLPKGGFNNLIFVINEHDIYFKEVIDRLANTDFRIVIDSSLLNDTNIMYFDKKIIKGIYVSKRLGEEVRTSITRIASLFNLDIISSFKINEYRKNMYLSNVVHEVK